MALSHTVFLDRANRTTAIKTMSGAADKIRNQKQSVYLFPEGTRSYSAEPVMLPFKKGAFHLALQAGVPIVPIVAENYSHILNIKKREFGSGSIRVKVLPPIPTEGMTPTDVDNLVTNTRESMLAVLSDMYKSRDEYSKTGRHQKVETPSIKPKATSSGVEY
ncbi:1-acylglycerol-3-phosphate O-acyltransferase [Ascosphaera atra]|nr:1-acylglycerol-3-phosphate O-acyltransferase [Ascosphaera atra]